MKKVKLVFMDGYDEVRDEETQEVIFSTKLPIDLQKYCDRVSIVPEVIDNVVNIWNKSIEPDYFNQELDDYLLNEERCTQDEREIILESIAEYLLGDFDES